MISGALTVLNISKIAWKYITKMYFSLLAASLQNTFCIDATPKAICSMWSRLESTNTNLNSRSKITPVLIAQRKKEKKSEDFKLPWRKREIGKLQRSKRKSSNSFLRKKKMILKIIIPIHNLIITNNNNKQSSKRNKWSISKHAWCHHTSCLWCNPWPECQTPTSCGTCKIIWA